MLQSKIDISTGFEKRYEKVKTVVFDNSTNASKEVAKEIVDLIRLKQTQNKICVLGLATGQ